MKIIIVYDNRTLDPNLTSGWGFACLVGDDLLFDTGGDGRTLLSNMAQMGIDPAGIRTVVLSHAHGDHTGGLGALLGTGDHAGRSARADEDPARHPHHRRGGLTSRRAGAGGGDR